MARTIRFDVDRAAGPRVSKVVSERFFGGNMLFDRDRIGDRGTFDDKVDALDIDFVRYPGGTIAERSFSLVNPDRVFNPADPARPLMPLSAFVDYAETAGHDWSLVLPTIRYMDMLDNGPGARDAMRLEVRKFLQQLKAGAYGDKAPTVIEIGNEFYAAKGPGSEADKAELYAVVARIFATEVRKVFGQSVEIAVQAGRDWKANNAILDKFKGAPWLVDKVIFHSYPWTVDQIGAYQAQKMGLAQKWLAAGVASGIFVSEYNMSNQLRDDAGRLLGSNEVELGMAKALGLVDMTIGLIAAGVDYAAVWPLQQNTPGDLAGDEGETGNRKSKLSDNDLTLSGEAYRLLSDVLVGKKLVASRRIDLDPGREHPRDETEATVHVFENRSEVVAFVSSWDLKPWQLGTTINLDLGDAYRAIRIDRLSTDGDPLNPNAAPSVESEGRWVNQLNGQVSLTLDDSYGLIRVRVAKMNVVRADEDGGRLVGSKWKELLLGRGGDDVVFASSGRDTLKGAGGDDVMFAGRGHDNLLGGQGADRMFGGTGRDRLAGGAADDTLVGGQGDDWLRGGLGDDVVKGGGGDDTLSSKFGDDLLDGGFGHDVLISHRGDDTLTGGAGADSFVFNVDGPARTVTVTDFTAGVDTIELEGGALLRTGAVLGDAGGDAVIEAGATRIVLKGDAGLDYADVGLGSAAEARVDIDGVLEVGVRSDDVFGHRYAGTDNPNGAARLAFNATGEDLTFTFRSYDIDVRDEVEVLLNGVSLGHLELVGNKQYGQHEFFLDAEDQIAGENIIEFRETLTQVTTWGVDDFMLS